MFSKNISNAFDYPWKRLDDHGLLIDTSLHSSHEMLRRPSFERHPSFEKLPYKVNNAVDGYEYSNNLTSFEHGDNSSNQNQVEQEIKIQNDYIFKKFGLYRHLIIPDGNCMYRALSQSLLHDQNNHLELRRQVVDYIKSHRQDFEPIIEGSFDCFVEEAYKKDIWGSYVELLAVTKFLSINIVIVTGGSTTNPDVKVTCHHFQPDKDEITPGDTVWLSWLSNGHYDVILPRKMENKEYDEWLAIRNRQMKDDEDLAKRLSTGKQFSSISELDNTVQLSETEKLTTVSNSPCDSADQDKVWTMEDDERLARTIQEEEDYLFFSTS